MSEQKQLRRDIKDIREKVTNMDIALRGREHVDTPEGIIFNVQKNTRFRENLTKSLWILFSANAGVGAGLIYLLIKIGG